MSPHKTPPAEVKTLTYGGRLIIGERCGIAIRMLTETFYFTRIFADAAFWRTM